MKTQNQPHEPTVFARAMAMGITSRKFMKTRFLMFKFLLFLCAIFSATAAFGQVNFIWTGAANPTNLTITNNWDLAGVPSTTLPAYNDNNIGDTMQFDGVAAGNLFLTVGASASYQGGSGNPDGLTLYSDSNEVAAVDFYSPAGLAGAIRFSGVMVDSGAGPFGIGDYTLNTVNIIEGGVTGQVHTFQNNSAHPAVLYPNIEWRNGGGGAHTFQFQGTGTWIVSNYLAVANPPGGINVTVNGPGTVIWSGANVPLSAGTGTLGTTTIAGGSLFLQSGDLLGTQNIVDNGVVLKYDAGASATPADTLAGIISGSGNLQVNSGAVTLKGLNTYTGTNILSGGEVFADSVETLGTSGPLGVGGTIVFSGGTLGYSVDNAYDYSPRFSTAAGQAYSIDTAGQNVTLMNALTSSGGTLAKLGSGTLTLGGANIYGGITAIGAGKLVIQGTAGSGTIIVSNSTALGVTGGSQITPGTLTVGTTSGATLEFNNVSSTTTSMIAAGTVSAGGPITINVNSGVFSTIGQSFPLISWSSGSAPAVVLGTLTGAGGSLSTNGNTIKLTISSLAFVWTGLGNGDWDLTSINNWKLNGSVVDFQNGGTALLDDTAAGTTNVILNATISPAGVTVNTSAHQYTITSSAGDLIGGSGGLNKSGTSALTLAGGDNTYSGVTTINGGTVSVGTLAPGGSASDIGAAGNAAANLVLNGGTLQYTGGGATSDHLFTLGTAGGTIDDEGSTLTLSNGGLIALSGTGARSLTLTGSDSSGDTFGAALADNGGATALTKSGTGTWIVTGNNKNSGAVLVTGGTLQVGPSGTLGSGNIVDDGSLFFYSSGMLTNGTISGAGLVDMEGSGTVILPGNNSYQGSTTINNGALQIGDGGATGSLYIDDNLTDNSLLIFNSTGSCELDDPISGSGNLIVRGVGGLFKAIGANSYTGWTEIDPGATFEPSYGNTGALATSVVTNNGTLYLARQDTGVFILAAPVVGSGRLWKDNNNFNTGDITLTASNTYTGGTLITGGIINVDNGSGLGWITGNVVFSNSAVNDTTARELVFERPDNVTFPGNIIGATVPTTGLSQGNLGELIQYGTGTLTLTGDNTYQGGTTVSNGVVQVGDDGTSGSLGTGPITDNSALFYDLSSSVTLTNGISGTGSMAQIGSGTLTLSGINTYTGDTAVSNGVLVVVGAVGGELDVSGGTVVAGPAGSTGTLAVTNNLNINSGTVSVTLNKSLAQSNSVFSVGGAITAIAGTVQVANAGPALKVGDRFVLFNQLVSGGSALTVTGGGATWNNNLGTDGSISVKTLLVVTPPKLNFTQSGNNLQFSWSGSFTLQVETNSLSTGLSNNWVNYTGGGTSPVTVPVSAATKGAVFFRLSQ
jgi:fibronectin-binding autotransporter adhesin